MREDTYELCYNSACLLLGKGLYEEAEKKLKKAEGECSGQGTVSTPAPMWRRR